MDMTDSMGPGKLVCHMQNLSYTYDEFLISIRLGPSISSAICKNPSQFLSQDLETGCLKLAVVKFWGVQIFKGDHNRLIFQP